MKQNRSPQYRITNKQNKPSTINKFFGYIKNKIKDNIDSLASKTMIEPIWKTQQLIDFNHQNIPSFEKQVSKKTSRGILVQKTLNITPQVELLLSMQVEKCKKNIPQSYFLQNYDIGKELFSKNQKQRNLKLFQLNDYKDEVQFNIQSLVSAKQPQLLTILDDMDSMNNEIQSLLINLRSLRNKNKTIKQNITGKAQKIKYLQQKQQKLMKLVDVIKNLKLLTQYPHQIKNTFIKNKHVSISLFKQYTKIHEQFRLLCGCSQQQYKQCQLIQCRNYLKNNLQQSFSKIYWNYLTQVLFYEKDELKNIFGNKKDFQSMPGMMTGFNLTTLLSSGILDQSVCDQENFELIIKDNIQQQIKSLIMLGISIHQFDNRNLLLNLLQFLQDFQKGFLSDILQQIKQNFMIDAENNLISQSKSIKLLFQQLKPYIQKIKMNKFLKVIEFYMSILKNILRRCFSVLHRVCKSLNYHQTFRRQEIQVLLGQVCYEIVNFSDQYLVKTIQLRHLNKQIDFSSFRKIIQIFQDLQNFSEQTFEYFIVDINSTSSFVNKAMCKFMKTNNLKINIVSEYFKKLHQNVLTKQLKSQMQQDSWVQVEIDPKYYNILGYILEGQKFNQDRKKMSLLSSSLLISKRSSIIKQKISFDYFRTTHQYLIIHEKRYKPTSSLLYLLEIVQMYLQINKTNQNLNPQVSTKLLQLLYFYNSYLFQLILNASAIHYNKIGNSITIKHLCFSYHSISLIICFINIFKSKIQQQQMLNKLMLKLTSHQQQIIIKIQSVIPYRISQQIKSITLQKSIPCKGTQNICNYLRNINDTLKQFFEQEQIRRVLNSNMLVSFINKLLKIQIKTKSQQQLLQRQISYFIIQTDFLANTMEGYETIKSQLQNIITINKIL